MSTTEDKSLRKRVAAITSALSASVYGISLMDNPVGFVAAAVMDLVIGWVSDGVGVLVGIVGTLFGQFTWALEAGGAAAISPFTAAGDILLDLVQLVQDLAVDLSMGIGPLAPIIAIVLWALVFALLGLLARIAIEIYRWLPGT